MHSVCQAVQCLLVWVLRNYEVMKVAKKESILTKGGSSWLTSVCQMHTVPGRRVMAISQVSFRY